MAKKNCSGCGQLFDCCNETRGCWCEDYVLDRKTLEELRFRYDNCLCENCIAELAMKDQQQPR